MRNGPPKGADAGPGTVVEFRGGKDTAREGNQGPPVRSLSLAVDPALMVRLNDRRDHAIWDLGDQPVARRRPRPGLAGHIGFRQDADVMQPGGQPESDKALFRQSQAPAGFYRDRAHALAVFSRAGHDAVEDPDDRF